MRGARYLVLVVLGGVMLAGCDPAERPPGHPVTTGTSDAINLQIACPRHGGQWAGEKGCVIDEVTPQATQHLSIPVLWDSSFPELQAAADQTVADIRAKFRASVQQAGPPTDGTPWALDVTFDTYRSATAHPTDGVRFTITAELGGYHPEFGFRTLTFDRVTKQAVGLDALLTDPATGLSKISELVRADLRKQFPDKDTQSFIDSGTTPVADNFRYFVLDGDALVFSFVPYQVAAYAAGHRESRLPLSELRGVVKPDYLPA